MKRGALVVVLALMLYGCGSGAPSASEPSPVTDSTPGTPVQTPAVAEPVAAPVDRKVDKPLVVPPVPNGPPELLPRALQVRPDGGAFALWILVQGEALVAWRAGDDHAVALPVSSRSMAWTPDGFYYIAQTGDSDNAAEIWRYRWDQKQARAVDRSQLRGAPQALAWSAETNQLLFADTAGLHAVAPDGGPVSNVAGPWGAGAVWSNVFEAAGLRYVTLEGQMLVAGTAGKPEQQVLTEIPRGRLSRVVWAPDGARVAVEIEESGGAASRIAVLDLHSPEQRSGKTLWQTGSNPVLLGDTVWFLSGAESQTLQRVSLRGGEPEVLNTANVLSLAAQPAQSRLYQIRRGRQIIWWDFR